MARRDRVASGGVPRGFRGTGLYRRAGAALGGLILVAAQTPEQAEELRRLNRVYNEYYDNGEYQAALDTAERALADLSLENSYWPHFTGCAAEQSLLLGDGDGALARLDAIVERHASHPVDTQTLCRERANRGRYYLRQGRADLASAPIERARALAEELRRDSTGSGTVRYAWFRVVQLEMAREHHEEVEELILECLLDAELWAPKPQDRADLLFNLGTVQALEELSKPTRAARSDATLRDSVALYEKIGNAAPLHVRALLLLADSALAAKDVAASRAYTAQARAELERLGAGTVRERALVAAREARVAIAEGAAGEALASEQAELESALERWSRDWTERPSQLGGRGYLQYLERRVPVSALIDLLVQRHEPERGAELALERLAALHGLGTLAQRWGDLSPSLDEMRPALPAAGGWLVYFPVHRGSHVLLLDERGALHEPLAPIDEIQDAARDYFLHLQAPLSMQGDAQVRRARLSRGRTLAADLAEKLLPPRIADRVRDWRAVTVFGLDLLGPPTPVEWIRLSPGDPYFGIERAVCHGRSIPFEIEAARRFSEFVSSTGPELALVCGGSVDELTRARWTHLEALDVGAGAKRALSSPYAAAIVLAGETATPERIVAGALSGVAVVQFLTHGVHDSARPRPRGLLLERGASGAECVLWAEDVDAIDAPRLALLTTCRSASGNLRRGDAATADLGGAFLLSGSQCALVSQSDLRLVPTVELSARFHEGIRARGLSPAAGLQRAWEQLGVDPQELPYEYGLLQVVGAGHLPFFAPSADGPRRRGATWPVLRPVLWIVLGVVLVGSLVAGWRLRRKRVE